MARLKIRTLGAFQVSIDGKPVTNFESNKVRALLAYLVVEIDRPHERGKLAGLFWPNMPPTRASSNLSQALYNLRKLICDHQAAPPYLLRTHETVQFNPQADYWLDVNDYKSILGRVRLHTYPIPDTNPECIERLKTAIELYAGDFLDGLNFDSSTAYDEWMLIERQRLQHLAMGSLHLLAEHHAGHGEIEYALPYAWRQVELDPLDEAACRQLMGLLDASGRRNQALAAFKRLQVMLSEELKVDPQPGTIALRDRIREEAFLLDPSKCVPGNLPAQLTSMIGRRRELAELQKCLENPGCRLLTILGPGGSGKSRLALELARSIQERYRHGVFFISINPIHSHESILPAVMEALGLQPQAQTEPQSQLANYLRSKKVLLVMDGFEHLREGAATLVKILHQAPELKILVTSRSKLNVKGEHVYQLGGMSYPLQAVDEVEILGADAVRLLLHGLQRVRYEFEPTPTDLKHLTRICRSVQGMPLGILLAASWGAALDLEEISKEISRSLDFLSAEWSDVPPRQRSMRATFEHSWNMLAERERRIFQSLSVFRGAFTRRAAKEVVGASPFELRALVDRSLLWNKSSGWYEMHELLRQYGREKLADAARLDKTVCSRHGTYYLHKLAGCEELLKNDQQVTAIANIDLEHENYRAAWKWAAAQAAAGELSNALDALCLYYDLSLRYQDGQSACHIAIQGLTKDQDDDKELLLQVSLFTWQSRFTRLLGKLVAARWLLDQAQALLEKSGRSQDSKEAAFFHFEKGEHDFIHDRAASADRYRQSLEIYRSMGDTWGTAKSLAGLGLIAHHAGGFQEAVRHYSESLVNFRAIGDPRGIVNALVELGHNSLRQGQVSVGQAYIHEGISILQQIGDKAGAARSYIELGRACYWTGEFQQGTDLVMKSAPIFEELGIRDRQAFALLASTLALSHLGKYEEVAPKVYMGLSIAKELGAQREIAMAYLALSMAKLGSGNFDQSLTWGQKSITCFNEIDQKDDLAWTLALVFFALRGTGNSQDAIKILCHTLEIGIEVRGVYPILCSLFGFALLCLDQHDSERAVELAALAWRYPVVAKSRWFEDIAGREIAATVGSLTPEKLSAAQERGRKLDLWETAEALLKEMSGIAKLDSSKVSSF